MIKNKEQKDPKEESRNEPIPKEKKIKEPRTPIRPENLADPCVPLIAEDPKNPREPHPNEEREIIVSKNKSPTVGMVWSFLG
ncbi:MAG: hypothetical protein K2P93_08345 [Alphaproteobacteria bacterium]|nr:hypothetical protein [Alphaproteobacteria bacterium]